MQHANIKFISQSSQIHFPLPGKSFNIFRRINCVYPDSQKELVSSPCEQETKISDVRAHSKLTAATRTSDYHGKFSLNFTGTSVRITFEEVLVWDRSGFLASRSCD